MVWKALAFFIGVKKCVLKFHKRLSFLVVQTLSFIYLKKK